tara:strand:- start:224 stop:559 length:336 start_codon:yes stop_codon:yes gene_type:complete
MQLNTEIPPTAMKSVTYSISTLRRVERSLVVNRSINDGGMSESAFYNFHMDRHAVIGALKSLRLFISVARRNGVNPYPVIMGLGGVPKVSRSEKARAYEQRSWCPRKCAIT